jgi:sporulation protein YlmC with PRC-barrel domain
MKLNSTKIRDVALVALLAGLSSALSAQSGHAQPATPTEQQSDASRMGEEAQQQGREIKRDTQEGIQQAKQAMQSGQLRKQGANELAGMSVQNRNGESLGKVKDFVVDASSGQVLYTVIGSGGVLGIGETLHAVPVSALNYDSTSGAERLTLDIAADRWSAAPRFRKDRISSLQADQEGRSTFEYYGQSWPASSQGQAGTSQPQQQQQLVMANDLIGKNLNSGGEKIGAIQDVLLQFQNRTAALLIDPSDDFAGTDQHYIVPFNKLTATGGDSLATSLTRQDLSSAQVAQGDAWASPGGSSIFVLPREERVAQNPDQSAQGQPPVAQIREALRSDTSIAQQGGQNVQVLAQGDKIVLLGTVQSEDAKDKIEERAEEAAQGWDVDNQIRVATAEE